MVLHLQLSCASRTSYFHSIKAEQFIFFSRRRHHIKNNVIELTVATIEGRLVTSFVGELHYLDAPFSKGGVFRDRNNYIKTSTRRRFTWPKRGLSNCKFEFCRTGCAELKTLHEYFAYPVGIVGCDSKD